jgi:trimeric autotransporter adhesin
MIKITFLSIISLLTFITAHSQVGIGTTTPSASSMLEIKSTNSGLLIPRINLTSSTDNTTIASPATSLLVYNTSSSADLTPGFYYWDGSWKALSGSVAPPVSGGNSWNLSGNNTVAADYMGTNNFFPIQFKVNNSDFAKFHPNGGINIGYNSVANNNNSVAIGTSALASTNNEAIALGASANASGYQSAALGYTSTASNNSALALGHLSNSSGYRSAALGYSARATNNNGLGLGNSSNATGEQSLAIGYESNVSGQNATAIGYQATTAQANAIVLGSSANTNNKVGIGTNSPDERLHVAGSVKIVDGTQSNGYVLTSDANGKASWKNPVDSNSYGEIYKTSNSGLATGAITLGTNGLSQGTTLNSNNIQVSKTGTYKITYSVTIRRSSGGTVSPEFYLGISGTEIPGTRATATLGNGDTFTITKSRLYNLTAFQAVTLYSNMTDGNTSVLAIGTSLLIESIN